MIETPKWMAVAQQEAARGVKEISGAIHQDRILLYHASTSLAATEDEVPWCAAFANFCIELGGHVGTDSARARSFLLWGVRISPPAYGAIVVLSRGPDPPGPEVIDAPGHVGFLVASPTPDEILVLAGNQADQVCVRPFPRDRILGVRWPDG